MKKPGGKTAKGIDATTQVPEFTKDWEKKPNSRGYPCVKYGRNVEERVDVQTLREKIAAAKRKLGLSCKPCEEDFAQGTSSFTANQEWRDRQKKQQARIGYLYGRLFDIIHPDEKDRKRAWKAVKEEEAEEERLRFEAHKVDRVRRARLEDEKRKKRKVHNDDEPIVQPKLVPPVPVFAVVPPKTPPVVAPEYRRPPLPPGPPPPLPEVPPVPPVRTPVRNRLGPIGSSPPSNATRPLPRRPLPPGPPPLQPGISPTDVVSALVESPVKARHPVELTIAQEQRRQRIAKAEAYLASLRSGLETPDLTVVSPSVRSAAPTVPATPDSPDGDPPASPTLSATAADLDAGLEAEDGSILAEILGF